MTTFTSLFSEDLNAMIRFHTSLGYSEQTYLSRATAFDRFCSEHYPDCFEINESLVMAWIRPEAKKNSGVLQDRISFIRGFAAFLKRNGKKAYVIPDKYSAGISLFMPYILSEKELRALFTAIDDYRHPSDSFAGELLKTYFRLTYTCGLRPQEGRLLKSDDVDLISGEIRIMNTKWHKSRTIVMSEDMRKLAVKYAVKKKLQRPPSDFFFSKKSGGPYTAAWMQARLKLCFALSKPTVPNDLLPAIRVYDLRHRFATTVLHRWLDEGKDISSRLPYLQQYMGHKDIASTSYYIHLLPENLIRSSGIDWEKMNALIPEVELWEK